MIYDKYGSMYWMLKYSNKAFFTQTACLAYMPGRRTEHTLSSKSVLTLQGLVVLLLSIVAILVIRNNIYHDNIQIYLTGIDEKWPRYSVACKLLNALYVDIFLMFFDFSSNEISIKLRAYSANMLFISFSHWKSLCLQNVSVVS